MEMPQNHVFGHSENNLNIPIDVNYGIITPGALLKVVKSHRTGCGRITLLHFKLHSWKINFYPASYIVLLKMQSWIPIWTFCSMSYNG